MSGKDYLKNMTYHRRVGNRIIKPNPPKDDEYWDDEMNMLYEDAFRWHINCLWNIMPSKNIKGLSCILDNLDKNGNMEAWKYGTKILKKLQHINNGENNAIR